MRDTWHDNRLNLYKSFALRNIFSLLLLYSNFYGQVKSVPDSLIGLPHLKLGEKIGTVQSEYTFFPYTCRYCDAADSVIRILDMKSLDQIRVNEAEIDKYCKLYFLDSVLYRIELMFNNKENARLKVLEFLSKEYDPILPKKEGKSSVVWENANFIISFYFYFDQITNEETHATLEIFSLI